MNTKNLDNLITSCLSEIDNLIKVSKVYTADSAPIINAKKVLTLLKKELEKEPIMINERILRSTVDLGMSGYKTFENTPVEKKIERIYEFLHHSVPGYDQVKPLGMEFGKQHPI